jgi:hypothetical protein
VCTKDQAYGLYVLPAVHVVVLVLRAPDEARPRKALTLAGVAGVAAAAFAVCHNLLFNAAGFVEHVRALVGPASADYRMFPLTADGQARLATATLRLIPWTLGWPGIVLVAAGVAAAAQDRVRACWLLLPALSYYLFFIAVVGYVYDRFLLPVTVILAVFGGAGVDRLLAPRGGRAFLRPAAAVLMAWIAWRAISLDASMLFDSRYGVEAWLREHAEPGAVVAWTGQAMYLPRLHGLGARQIPPAIDATRAADPDFIVVNAEYAQRYPPNTPAAAWWVWLHSEDAPYEPALRRKTRIAWSALRFERRLWDGREDPFTNADKINPEIVVFQRRDAGR